MMTFVEVSGIAAIANDPETTMAVAVAAAIAAVMLRIVLVRASVQQPTTCGRAPTQTVYGSRPNTSGANRGTMRLILPDANDGLDRRAGHRRCCVAADETMTLINWPQTARNPRLR